MGLRWLLAAAFRLTGLILAGNGRLRAAAACYRRALRVCPGDAALSADLAACLAALHEPQAALALCAAACEKASDDPFLNNNLGRLFALQGDHSKALEHYGRALALAPSLGATWANLGASLLAVNRPRLALAAYRRALALAPELTGSHWGEAACLERLGRAGSAAAAYNRALGQK